MERRRSPLSRAALALALVFGALWIAVDRAPPTDGHTLTAPVAPGRTLHMVVWSRERVFIDTEFNHSAMVHVSEALTVAFWYQNNRAGTARRLLTLRLPSWPLLVAAGMCGAMALIAAQPRPWRQPRS
jgi:hypothetical protein